MNIQREEADLALADRHISEAKLLISTHQVRLAAGVQHGEVFDQSTRLLMEMNVSLELMYTHRAQILAAIAQARLT